MAAFKFSTRVLKGQWRLIPSAVRLLGAIIAAIVVLACGSDGSPAIPSPTLTPESTEPVIRLEDVAKDLEVPWALAFAPDGRLFFTERPGRLRVIKGGVLLGEPVASFPVAHQGEAGLLGLALDPDFARNHYLYVYYTYGDGEGNLWNRVVKLREEDEKAFDPQTLLDKIPGAGIHDGGRLKFGLDGKLYITTGDATRSELAQRLDSLAGKILRLNPDGSIPADNPFPGSPVYSLGHRNPQGLAWHPQTGQLYATEHGSSAHDEVNLIRAGGNYGWPQVRGRGGVSAFLDPVVESGEDTWAPSGAVFPLNVKLSAWRNNLFFAALRGQHLHRFRFSETTQVIQEERLLEGELGRLRDVIEGPDGYLYLATNNRDGRGSPRPGDDRILRLVVEGQ